MHQRHLQRREIKTKHSVDVAGSGEETGKAGASKVEAEVPKDMSQTRENEGDTGAGDINKDEVYGGEMITKIRNERLMLRFWMRM